MKLLTLTAAMLMISLITFAQQVATIKGKISTSNGRPAPFISIGLKDKGQGTTSDDAGNYTIHRVKPGTYTIVASAVGIKASEQSITIAAGESKVVNFTLVETDQALEEVTVAGKNNRYKIGLPSASLRLNEPLLEAPQNIQTVSDQVIKDQQIISMSDGLIRNVSGATRIEHWGDMYTNITMRGSQIQAMRNGFNVVSSFWGPLTEDMSFVDHIEFVKGPAGFMLGNGDPSGMYNVVTKKPTGFNRGEVSFTLGSYDLYRTTIDFDRKLTNDGKLLFRLNGAVQNKGSFRPYEQNDRYSIAPVLSYQITNRTKITAEYTFQNAKMTEVGSYYIFSPDGYATYPRELTMTQPGIPPTRINDQSLFLNLQHNFDDNWKLTAQAAYFKYNQVGYSSWPSAVNANSTVIRNVAIWDSESSMKLAQLFINGKVKTGGINHRILAGFDGGKKNYMADWGQSHNLDLPTAPFDLNNPNYSSPLNGYPDFDRTTPLAQRAINAGGLMDSKYLSAYAQDELGFFNNKVRLTLAGRYTYVNQSAWGGEAYSAKKVTPRVGLSVSIDKNTAVYAVYDEAFTPQSGLIRNGGKVEPITGTNNEIGIKKDWFDGKWNTTLSVYRILKQNELTADPTNVIITDPADPANPIRENFSVVLGEKRSQGLEFDLRGKITDGLTLIANYAYTDSKVTEVTPGVTGINVGDVVPGFAKHVSNGWLTYTLQDGALKGSGISAGFTYLAGRATDTWSVGLQKLPNYFKLDGGLFYERSKFKITGNVFNILDKYLYSGSYYQYLNAYYYQAEAPRNYRVSIAYKF
ncbi:iron complex outermembrane receptor protein [Pedobacter psychrotolerans]|uniref:Iron complex outermembrane receptor protein n=1 Tax=Pedobacter psychrotolerans TaxID=1843235 RepID=A0A4R2HKY6_9SPHI|nr:TonB-dependent receptor [Pedobacter psychrotolerans]TCO29228.1 iron complex outermembrane receptor protein [Pedobacter psychrotolerans]GGE55152.1 ligand-gated channel [Pedobacter psychrotolerans]